LDHSPSRLARWSEVLLIVKPETVIGRHRTGFRLYWRWRSRSPGGRPRITKELQELITRLAKENPEWGTPKIHAELQKLGFTRHEYVQVLRLLETFSLTEVAAAARQADFRRPPYPLSD
jgi:hypothetical protein